MTKHWVKGGWRRRGKMRGSRDGEHAAEGQIHHVVAIEPILPSYHIITMLMATHRIFMVVRPCPRPILARPPLSPSSSSFPSFNHPYLPGLGMTTGWMQRMASTILSSHNLSHNKARHYNKLTRKRITNQ